MRIRPSCAALLLLIVAAAPARGADTHVLPKFVTELFNHCLEQKTKAGKVSRRVCYPDLPEAPLDQAAFTQVMNTVAQVAEKGAPIKELLKQAGNGLGALFSNCERKFSEDLLQSGLSAGGVTLPWADAIVFSSKYKDPRILLNTDPDAPGSGGITVVLPFDEVCLDRDRTVANLRAINREWYLLVQAADASPEDQSILDRAFENPATIFQVMANRDGCPELTTFARSAVHSPKPPAPPAPSVYRQEVVEPATQLQVEMRSTIPPPAFSHQERLEEWRKQGIAIDAFGITVRGQRIPRSAFVDPSSPFGITDMVALSEKVGIELPTLMRANELRNDAEMEYVIEYRRKYPLPKNQYYDLDSGGHVVVGTYDNGCEWNETVRQIVCPNGMRIGYGAGSDLSVGNFRPTLEGGFR